MIDINADPFIEEIIEIPETHDAPEKLSYEVAAATMPFMDITPYIDSSSKNYTPGISNFFKSKLRYATSDTASRLKRMHRNLKKAWYLESSEKTIEYMIG